ncbi:NMT1/THI5 like protein [compost metagenome]
MKNIFALIFSFQLLALSAMAAPKVLTLALNWKAEPEFGGFYAAEIDGEFKKRGLDVKILEGGSGTPTIQMLANGKVDFAIVSADEIIIAQERNPKNKVIGLFAVYQTSPYIIMSHEERGFKTLKEVFTNDGILSIQSGLPYYQFLVKKFGPPKVKVVPYLGGIANFVNDRKFSQQGFITTEPLSALKAGKKPKSFLIAEEGFNPYLVVVATTEESLKKNPELAKKMIEAVRAGWLSYLKSPDKTNKFMSELNKSFDYDTFQKAAKIQEPLIQTAETLRTGLGAMNDNRWEILVQQLKDLNLIKSTPVPQDLYKNL